MPLIKKRYLWTPILPLYLERSNVTIAGISGPDTQTIVFLHCLGGDQSNWRLITPAFQDQDQYQVVLLDLIGAGKSDLAAYKADTIHSTLDGHATDLLGVMSTLALHDVVFVGHSVAAMIGVIVAAREPQRFAKMVLVSPSPRFINETGYADGFEQKDINELLAAMEADYNGWSRGFSPMMMGSHESPELGWRWSSPMSLCALTPKSPSTSPASRSFPIPAPNWASSPSPRSSCNWRTTLLRPSPWATTSTSNWPTAA